MPRPKAQASAESTKSSSVRSARGERARAGLKEAALAVLERDGYHKMRIADVTRVQDQIDAFEQLQDLWAKLAVRVADQPDSHRAGTGRGRHHERADDCSSMAAFLR